MAYFQSTTIQSARMGVSKNLRDVFDGLDSGVIEQIAEKDFVDKYVLRRTTSYILLGLLPFRLFVDELMDELGIIEEDAIDVVKDVRKYILAPVLKDLAEVQEQAEDMYKEFNVEEG